MAWEVFYQPTIIVPFALLSFYLLFLKKTKKTTPFNGLPWIGTRPELFSEIRANWSSIKQARMLMEEGYYKYSKQAKSFVLPSWASSPEVIIPTSQIRWLADQPDDVLSAREVHHEILEADYVFQYAHAVHHPIHEDVIRRDLNRQLPSLTMEIMKEFRKHL
ncbi:MAG: hypothetical protein M1830_005561 [Pleopsidium flavum]|nr:MAG: hypothetical protein M1830_005561 [Pleopsidium flavum]